MEGDVIYLLGNPVVWGVHCLYFIAYFAFWTFSAILEKRGIALSERQKGKLNFCLMKTCFNCYSYNLAIQSTALRASNWIFVGFLLHYVPFWPMVRILYIHHYFPALLFSNMLSGIQIYLINFSLKIKMSLLRGDAVLFAGNVR